MKISPKPGAPRKNNFAAWIVLAGLLIFSAARTFAQDDDYLAIYGDIEQADALNSGGKTALAHAKYLAAQQELAAFKRTNPGWNEKMVSFRLNYLADQITATSGEKISAKNDDSSAATASSGKPKMVSATISPVKLLDAGSEPRTVLRLHPAVGDKQSVSMTMKMGMAMSAGGNAMPAMDLPAMVMTMDSEVKNISPDGEIAYAIVFNDVDVVSGPNTMAAAATAMKTALAGLRGMAGDAQMSDRGVLKSMNLKPGPGADPQLSQAIGQMKDSFSSSSSPLPEEAVGVGAKWEYHTHLKSQGMNVDQDMTLELVSIDGDKLTLRSTIAQNAANQKIQNPAMPNLKVDLTKLTGNGSGNSTLDLNHLMPQSATLDEDTETAMSMNVGQKKQDMDMKMSIKVTLEAK